MALNRNQAVLSANMALNQIVASNLSKKGLTSLTGVFEGAPQNYVNQQRGFTVPQGGTPDRGFQPLDVIFTRNNPTYVEYMRNANRK